MILQFQLGYTKESFICPDRAIKGRNEVPIFKLFSIINLCELNVCEQIFLRFQLQYFAEIAIATNVIVRNVFTVQ